MTQTEQARTTEPANPNPAPFSSGGWLEAGVAILDGSGTIVATNPALAEWLGKPEAELIGCPLPSLLEARCGEWSAHCTALDQSPGTFARCQWELPSGNGRPAQWFQAELTRLPSGQVFRLNSILPPGAALHDQGSEETLGESARREVYFRLVRAEERLDHLMERWPGIVFSQRPDGSFYFVSPRIEELTGVPRVQWEKQARGFWDVIHEADLQQMQQQVKLASTSPQALTSTFRIRHSKTGKVAYILEHRQAVTTASGLLLGYEGVWLDLTRQTLVEKRLNAAAWKETLATLTMGLAHDFRNVMAGILALTETFQVQLPKEHPFQQGLELMRSNSWQASQSVQRILQLYQGKSGEKSYQDLNELVREMAELSRRMLTRRLAFETRFAPERLPVYVDAFEFRQAFLNLAVNARDAMPRSGRLEIETSHCTALPELGFVRGALPRLPAVRFTMRDTGCGIAPAHLGSIFDPFFTTKALDKGSGLGLYNVLLFVEKHQGAVSVESEEGKGTAFTLWLPEADFTEADRRSLSSSPSHTLLLLGAPGQSLDGTAEFLRQNGFFIVTATSASATLDFLRSPHYHFSALILQTTAQPADFPADIKKEQLPVKRVLQVVGRNLDEVESPLLEQADLVLPAEMSGQQVAARIRSLLTEPA